jgi:hypothetical protein
LTIEYGILCSLEAETRGSVATQIRAKAATEAPTNTDFDDGDVAEYVVCLDRIATGASFAVGVTSIALAGQGSNRTGFASQEEPDAEGMGRRNLGLHVPALCRSAPSKTSLLRGEGGWA